MPESKEEYLKAWFEYLRHLTTLSTGSIVLVAAFLEKLFQKPLWKLTVVISLVGFMVSILSSVILYSVLLIYDFPSPDKTVDKSEWTEYIGGTVMFLTWAGFLIGILSLAIFAIRNFLQ